MRPDITVGATFPDYQLSDHNGDTRRLYELQGDAPMILLLSRGHYCPKERRQLRNLVDLYPELKVGYTEVVLISTDSRLNSNALRDSLGAQWTFLHDPRRTVQKDLDIQDYTDPINDPMIPYTIVLDQGLKIHKIYMGYWYWGRPSIEELRADLRELFETRPDWDISKPQLRRAWERGDHRQFYPYKEEKAAS